MAVKLASLLIEFAGTTVKLQESVKEATNLLHQTQKQMHGFTKGINQALSLVGVGVSFAGLKKLNEGIESLAAKGERLNDIQEQFTKLGGSSASISKAKEAVLGVVSSADLMAASTKGLIKGLPEWNEHFSKIVELGFRLSEALGIEAKEGVDRVTQAFIRGKPAQLAQLGIFVSAKDQAGKLGQAYAQLGTALESFSVPAASVTTLVEANNVKWDELKARIGGIIDESPELIEMYSLLGQEMEGIDYAGIAEALSKIQVILVGLKGTALELAQIISEWTNGEELVAGWETVKSYFSDKWKGGYGTLDDATKDAAIKLKGQGFKFSDQGAENQKIKEQAEAERAAAKAAAERAAALKQQAAAAAAAAKQQEALRQKVLDLQQDVKTDSIKAALEGSIKDLDKTSFADLLKQYKDTVREGVLAGYKDANGEILDNALQAADEKAEIEGQAYEERMEEATTKVAEDLKKAHEDAVAGWQTFFENAITGATFDFTDMMKQVAVGFAAELAASVQDEMNGLDFSSPQKLGNQLASSLVDYLNGYSQPEGVEGIGPVANGETYGAMLDSSGYGKMLGQAAQYAGVIQAVLQDAQGIGKNSKETSVGLGSAIGAGIGAWLGGPIGGQIGEKIGKQAGYAVAHIFSLGGPTNKNTLARINFSDQFNEAVKAAGGIHYFDSTTGSRKELTELNMGSTDQFSGTNWLQSMDQYGEKAKGTFLALGDALTRVYGIEEDVGGQMGKILADNLGGSVDAARMAVKKLGVSFEDLEAAELEAAEAGEMRWAEFNVSIQNLNNAYGEGLEAVGDYVTAFENLVNSGGRGTEAAVSAQNVLIEAQEAGATSLAQAQQMLLDSGLDPEYVNALFSALEGRGITTLEQVKSASTQTMGAVVGDMEAASSRLGEVWGNMGDEIDELAYKLDNIPKELTANVKVNADIDPTLQILLDKEDSSGGSLSTSVTQSASGNMFTSPTLSLMAESGPEAILPLARMNGKLGVLTAGGGASGLNVYIDAREAAPGIENKLMAVMRRVSKQEIAAALTSYSRRARGV